MKKALLVVTTLLCLVDLTAQQYSSDYLKSLEDEELLSLFNEVIGDSLIAEKVARTYLERGRQEKDTIKMARGYDRLARIFNPRKNISFADSIIELTNDLNNITYPALGYMLRGFGHYSQNDVKKSLQDFSVAYEISKRSENISQQMVVLDILIYFKATWGNKNEALLLQKERHDKLLGRYYEQEVKRSTRQELNHNSKQLYLEDKILSIQNYIYCYLSLKKVDSARNYLSRGLEMLADFNGASANRLNLWFQEASTEIEYYSGNYEKAIEICDGLLSRDELNRSSSMNVTFFKGLSLIELNKYDEGIISLERSDSIYENARSVIPIKPYKRELFERLLKHYQERGNSEKSILYMKKLLLLDSIFKINYLYFEPTHIKQFETPKLLEDRDNLISELTISNKKFKKTNWWIIFILSLSIVLLAFYIHRQTVFKRRFVELQLKISKQKNENHNGDKSISPNIIEEILKKLAYFESQNLFLKKDLYLHDLAKSFGTNSNYLSRVINLKMEKNYSQYIHHLRVHYSMDQLLTNKKFRNYTIKAIAEECGYTNAESYSRAFYKINGIYPSYFIKKLNQKKG